MSASTSTTAAPSSYSPTPIANGTYYLGAQSFGVVLEFYSAIGNLTASNFTGDTSQQWQVTGSPASTERTPSYAFKNIRYNSYISCITPPRGYFYLSQSNKPCIFYARGSNGGYLFSSEPGLSVFWDVPDEVDVVILEHISSATVMILATLNQSSSFISSAIAISSTSGTSGPITTPTSTPTAPATVTTASQNGGGMSQSDKINLGVGIGIGFPSFIVALLSAWFAFRSIRRRWRNQGTDNREANSPSTISSGG